MKNTTQNRFNSFGLKLIPAILIILVMGSQQVNSQMYQHWVKKYKGEDNFHDFGNGMAVDNSGNVYVGGSSDSAGGNRFYINKYSPSGNLLWTAIYNNTDLAEVVDLAIDNNYGNVVITGRKGYFAGADIITVKYNLAGVFQWAKIFNGPGNNEDIAREIAVDGQGNVYVTGTAYYSVSESNNYVTIKYDYNGNLAWSSYYNRDNHNDNAYSLAVDNGGNVYVTGISGYPQTNPPMADFVTVKYNSSGVQQWFSNYTGHSNYEEGGLSIALDNSGNIYAAGYDQDSNINNAHRPVLLKINNSGTILWAKLFYGEPATSVGSGHSRSVVIDNSGNVFVCGEFLSTWEKGNNAMTLKYNSAGDLQWYKLYDYNGHDDYGRKIKLDASGNPCIAAEINQAVTGYNLIDIVTIKYSSAGVQSWLMRYDRDRDYPKDMAIDNSGNVYVAGTIDEHLGWGRANDAFMIKYSPDMLGVNGNNGEVPNQFSLKQNYPNPFNPTTVISFQLTVNSFSKLIIYDILGNEISILVNAQLKAGTYNVDWNASGYPSGVYFYKLIAGGYSETRKAILIK